MNLHKLNYGISQEMIEQDNRTKLRELEDLYRNLKNQKEIKSLNDETIGLIHQIDERIRYWENRRTVFLQTSLGILGAGLAGLVAISSKMPASIDNFFNISSFLIIPIFILSFFLVIGCIKILFLWNKQNNPPYPFTKSTKIWRWQYRHAESKPNRTDFDNFDKDSMEYEATIFTSNLLDYKFKTLKSNSIELLDQNLSQLYLLMINEKFKIEFVSCLRDNLFKVLNQSLEATWKSLFLLTIIFFLKLLLVR